MRFQTQVAAMKMHMIRVPFCSESLPQQQVVACSVKTCAEAEVGKKHA